MTTEPTTFESFNLADDLLRALDDMGFAEPTPVQSASYEPVAAGRDVIVQARTGTGKTAAYGLPMLSKLIRTDPYLQALVLCPTRELALQIRDEIGRLARHRQAIKVAAVYGGAPMGQQVRDLEGGAQIVCGTPGRVLDHLRRGTMSPSRMRVLVLDEADEMLSMGFARELNAILELLPKERQTLLFSATVPDDIRRLADRQMTDPVFLSLSSDQIGASEISHSMYFVSGTGRVRDLIRIIEVEDPESAIVFCNMKDECEAVASALQKQGYDADWLNGDLPQSAREEVMGRTKRHELRFLVATDVAARGIDISHLTHVINFSFPENAESYVHRTGRTGRAGRTGTAISLLTPRDVGALYLLRLQYKIPIVERSLPTSNEEETRRQLDRLQMLVEAFASEPDEADRALARRLLTHADCERIIAGLLHTFFTPLSRPDDQAAAARRSRNVPRGSQAEAHAPAPAPAPDRAERRRERPRDQAPASLPSADRGGARGDARGQEPITRDERPSAVAMAQVAPAVAALPAVQAAAPVVPVIVDAAPPVIARPSVTVRADQVVSPTVEPAVRAAAEPDEDALTLRPPPRDVREARNGSADDEGDEDVPSDEGMATLYVNLGRRDGVRAGDLSRLLRARAGFGRRDIGRIRVRDKHSFVGVKIERVQEAIDAITGSTLHDRALTAEMAKGRTG
ncbi:MAG: DEAD/DEAH box helicase [Deltaproteobacteria bacterium]|nr:DEAD/DEAH box helicase [Deltaproteobacteria bacterium]